MTAIQSMIVSTLLDVGVNPGLLGYDYLKAGIELVYNDRQYLRGITKKLYPEIASSFGTTSTRVERAISHSIDSVFSNTPPETLKSYFGNVVSASTGKVTNTTFIATMVEHISEALKADGLIREEENRCGN